MAMRDKLMNGDDGKLVGPGANEIEANKIKENNASRKLRPHMHRLPSGVQFDLSRMVSPSNAALEPAIPPPWAKVDRDGNRSACEVCGGVGDLTCCDGCPATYHVGCIPSGPSLEYLEEEGAMEEDKKWFCPLCWNAQGSLSPPKTNTESPILKVLKSKSDNIKACMVCRGVTSLDEILLCDSCDSEYHTYCLDPPLKKIPMGEWFCPDCEKGGTKKQTRQTASEKDDTYDDLPRRSRRSGNLSIHQRVLQAKRKATGVRENRLNKFSKNSMVFKENIHVHTEEGDEPGTCEAIVSALLWDTRYKASELHRPIMPDMAVSIVKAAVKYKEYKLKLEDCNQTMKKTYLSIKEESMGENGNDGDKLDENSEEKWNEARARLADLARDVEVIAYGKSSSREAVDGEVLVHLPSTTLYPVSGKQAPNRGAKCMACREGWNHICYNKYFYRAKEHRLLETLTWRDPASSTQGTSSYLSSVEIVKMIDEARPGFSPGCQVCKQLNVVWDANYDAIYCRQCNMEFHAKCFVKDGGNEVNGFIKCYYCSSCWNIMKNENKESSDSILQTWNHLVDHVEVGVFPENARLQKMDNKFYEILYAAWMTIFRYDAQRNQYFTIPVCSKSSSIAFPNLCTIRKKILTHMYHNLGEMSDDIRRINDFGASCESVGEVHPTYSDQRHQFYEFCKRIMDIARNHWIAWRRFHEEGYGFNILQETNNVDLGIENEQEFYSRIAGKRCSLFAFNSCKNMREMIFEKYGGVLEKEMPYTQEYYEKWIAHCLNTYDSEASTSATTMETWKGHPALKQP